MVARPAGRPPGRGARWHVRVHRRRPARVPPLRSTAGLPRPTCARPQPAEHPPDRRHVHSADADAHATARRRRPCRPVHPVRYRRRRQPGRRRGRRAAGGRLAPAGRRLLTTGSRHPEQTARQAAGQDTTGAPSGTTTRSSTATSSASRAWNDAPWSSPSTRAGHASAPANGSTSVCRGPATNSSSSATPTTSAPSAATSSSHASDERAMTEHVAGTGESR